MLNYLNDIYSYDTNEIANEHIQLFLLDKESFEKIQHICYQPILLLNMYNDALAAGYQPLIDEVKIALERSVENVKLHLSK